jgi:hypothetical protein
MKTLREMPRSSSRWAKRVMPENGSRTISGDHDSSTASRQFPTEHDLSLGLVRSTLSD